MRADTWSTCSHNPEVAGSGPAPAIFFVCKAPLSEGLCCLWATWPVDFTPEEDDINSNPFSTGLPEGK